MHTYVYIYIHMHTHKHTYTYVYICIHMYTQIYICIHMQTYVYMLGVYTCIHARCTYEDARCGGAHVPGTCKHAYAHEYVYVTMCIHTYTYICQYIRIYVSTYVYMSVHTYYPAHTAARCLAWRGSVRLLGACIYLSIRKCMDEYIYVHISVYSYDY